MPRRTDLFAPCRDCVCSVLRRASRAVTQHYEAQFRGSGLRATQFTILARLTQTEPLAISHLANALGVERTTLTRNLRPLERRNLIAISGDRARLVSITSTGETLALKTLPRWRQAEENVGKVLARFNLPAAVSQRSSPKKVQSPKNQK
jgi:DNA-binding MarR family transcriptional regulator